jgi:hypothetical protein
METRIIEYYDRETRTHGIGNFVQLNDQDIEPGTKFIVPSRTEPDGRVYVGCAEGRAGDAYLKPILLTFKYKTGNHAVTHNHGAWRLDLCWIELP